MYTINELAFILDRSTHAINLWYVWKRQNPDHELAKYLPDPQQKGYRSKRLWKESDIEKLKTFMVKMPRGRNGIMGDVTQPKRRTSDGN